MSDVLTVVAGWDLPNGVIDSVEPFDVARHLPQVHPSPPQLIHGVLAAAALEEFEVAFHRRILATAVVLGPIEAVVTRLDALVSELDSSLTRLGAV